MYYQSGKDRQAIDAFVRADRIRPGLLVPNLFLGLEYVKLKRYAEALPYLQKAGLMKPEDVQVELGLGHAYLGTGHTRLAIHSYLRATQIASDNADAWYRLGLCYLQQVETDARALVTQHKGSAYLQALTAENLAERHELMRAANSYEKLAALKVPPPGTHSDYGFVLLDEHDLPGATREFQAELASTPGSLPAKLGMARIHVEQDAIEEGATEIARILGVDPGFFRTNMGRFNTGLSEDKRSELLRAMEKKAAAGNISKEALALFQPDTTDLASSDDSRSSPDSSNAGTAADLFAHGQYGPCAAKLASHLSQLSAEDLSLLAFCAYSTGDYHSAFGAAERLAVTPGTEAEGLYWETRSGERLAAHALARAGSIDSHSPKLHILLGDINRQKNQLQDAEREYRKALALRPGDTGALFGLSLALLGDSRIDDAFAIAQSALKDHSDDPELNAVLGEILCERNDFAGAEAYLKKSLNTKPEYTARVHELLGRVYANTDRLPEAIAELKLALPEDKDGQVYYQIGRLYLKSGDRVSAQKAFAVSKRLESEGLSKLVVSPQQGEDSVN